MASFSGLETQIGMYCSQRKWGYALTLYRECWDRFHRSPNLCGSISWILCHLNVSDLLSQLERESEAGSGSSDYLLAQLYNWGSWGILRNRELALKYIHRAADRGYPLALYQIGVETDYAAAHRYFLASAQGGCPAAMRALAIRVQDDDRLQAALWLSKASELDTLGLTDLRMLLKSSPQRCIPYGIWRPERIYHRLLPHKMNQALFTWLLVARRRRLARYVALLVCSFIVTRSGW